MIEPVGVIAIWLLIFGIRRGFKPIFDLDLVIFLTVGNITYNLFSSIVRRSLNAIEANKALFFYNRVKPVDTVIARSLVETNSCGFVYVLIILIYSFFQNIWFMNNLALIGICYLCISIIGIGIGLIFMSAVHRFGLLKPILIVILRPLYFISAVFYPLTSLPEWLKPLLSWNPLLQAIELSRKGFTVKYQLDNLISFDYLLNCTLIIITISLYIYIKNERILLTR